jgi:surface antigen
MKSRLFHISAVAAFFAAMCWTTAAFAHHRDGHQRGGSGYKGGGGYKAKSKRRGGGPPPWAPAHGYRAKHKYYSAGRYQEVAPADLVELPDAGTGNCNRETLGTVLGAAAGAAAGTQIGSGSGQILATIGGTIIGALVGGNIGRAMDQVDQHCVGQVLERAPNGQSVGWQNPDQGGQYQVTPTRTYQTSSGQYCREYQTRIVIAGKVEDAHGTACRQSDGSWQKTRY